MYRFILIFLLPLFSGSLLCQDSVSVLQQLETDGVRVFRDGERYFTAPFRFSGGEWLTTGAAAGGTALLFTLDDPVRTVFRRNHSRTADRLSDVGSYYGNGKYAVGLSGAIYIAGTISKSRDVRETGILVFESVLFAGITTNIVKSLAGRSRPYTGEGVTRFRGFQLNDDHLSLPSGHSTVAFAVSSVLARRLDNLAASVGLYSLATITAASRIYEDEHWLSDTVLGAIIGTVTGLAVSGYHDDEEHHTSFLLSPTLDGVRVSFVF